MPPKQKITKEELLHCAYEIILENGSEALTVRSLAERANCSIQPVFSRFETASALKEEAFDYVCAVCGKEISEYSCNSENLAKSSEWVLRLAMERPNIFKFLYLSDSYKSKDLLTQMLSYSCNMATLERMTQLYGLSREHCLDILQRSFLLLHGTASMICVNHVEFTLEAGLDIMKRTVAEMVKAAKEAEK
ncbi:MAG: TetR/AcrR family transcriptional regulator [Oscillospiraceae bacterium]|nr:TetR/AcrR family transcriptional regulator [Oscillospiraceae bacterium]